MWDHPRSRGVYRSVWSRIAEMNGSSPLARGLPSLHGDSRQGARIIPARAGFTRSRNWRYRRQTDHPRSRGVYNWDEYLLTTALGSSPLARGLRGAVDPQDSGPRIIPARAGFTLADPWNPNDEPHYQTAFAFTAGLVLAPQSSDSAVVSQRSTRTPSEA